LHELERAAEEQMVLLGALLDPDEELVIFVDQGADQRLVIAGEQRDELGEIVGIGQREAGDDGAAAEFAVVAGLADGVGLLLDVGDGTEEVFGSAMDDVVLLALEEGEHFAVILEFVAQGGDEIIEEGVHGCELAAWGKG
jgi:hypothetical protein